MKTIIPFSGFYYSIHESELDRALESIFSDYETGCDVDRELVDKASDIIDWQAVKLDYVKAYAKKFSHEFGLSSLTFETLDYPRFYNFATDRIFCDISAEDVQRLYDEVDEDELSEYVRENFTSRDGFASFYDPDVETWGDVLTWDHNQLGALVQVNANAKMNDGGEGFDQWQEYALCEDFSGNGLIDNWLFSAAPELNRLVNVHAYLQKRSERVAA